MAAEDESRKGDNPWLTHAAELRNGVLVGAALVATLAFQSFVSPPGGFWQDDSHDVPANATDRKNHTAGDPIWRDKNPTAYRGYQIINWIAFLFSGITIWATLWSVVQSKRGRQLYCAYLAYSFTFGLLLGNLILVYVKLLD